MHVVTEHHNRGATSRRPDIFLLVVRPFGPMAPIEDIAVLREVSREDLKNNWVKLTNNNDRAGVVWDYAITINERRAVEVFRRLKNTASERTNTYSWRIGFEEVSKSLLLESLAGGIRWVGVTSSRFKNNHSVRQSSKGY
jgi:hypothetical protein